MSDRTTALPDGPAVPPTSPLMADDRFAPGITVIGDAGDNALYGTHNDDTLNGMAGNDVLNGEDGYDWLIGGGGNDVLNGGDGIDTGDYSAAASGVTARLDIGRATNDGDGGVDILNSIERLYGSAFNDVLIGDGQDNLLFGGAGYDVLIGGAGNDRIYGGVGAANELYGGAGDDTFYLDANDTVVELAGGGIDTVRTSLTLVNLAANVENLWYDGPQDFTGNGNAEDNVITGGSGNDVLRGGVGNDTLNGRGGMDAADYSTAASGIHARLDYMTAFNDGDGGVDTYVDIEAIVGSAFDDLLVGGALDDHLSGGLGRDTLLGGAGNDVLSGGQGVANALQGGVGDDRYILDANDTIVELAGEGFDTVEVHIGAYVMAANLENMEYVGQTTFNGTGNAGNNNIYGGDLNDVLRGGGGDDHLYGGRGDDTVVLRGAAGDYTITGDGVGYRIVDAVPGRDGSTYVTDIETVLFEADGTTRTLSYTPPPAPSELIDKADYGDAQVLPGVIDDAFLDLGGVDFGPQTLPPVFDDFLVLDDGLSDPVWIAAAHNAAPEIQHILDIFHGDDAGHHGPFNAVDPWA